MYRGLKLNNRENVEKYIDELERIYSNNKFIPRLDKVVNKIHHSEGEVRDRALQKLDKMDKERSDYMKAAEKSLGIKKGGDI